MSSRRSSLAGLTQRAAQHPGLWLDKYISGYARPATGETPQAAVIREVCAIPEPDGYDLFYRRWEQSIRQVERVQVRYARALGRLAVGLGAESVLETSIALHRTYGLPYIPGSALKGLAAAYAHQRLDDERWRKGGDAHRVMFGTTAQAGYVTFFDALYTPRSGHDGRALWPDVITVHHPDYYQRSGGNLQPPADWDSPTPVPFVTATGSYFVALAGPPAWVEAALGMLEGALRDMGVGAKTSSGYGRMSLVTSPGQATAQNTQRLSQEAESVTSAVGGVPVVPSVPSPPPEQLEKLDVGVEVTGNRKGELRIPSGRGVRVDLNLKGFQLPRGRTVVGFVSRADAGGSTSGGFRGIIDGFEVDGTTLYLILKPKSNK
jgi:CRISPR-associated protein Cmr6